MAFSILKPTSWWNEKRIGDKAVSHADRMSVLRDQQRLTSYEEKILTELKYAQYKAAQNPQSEFQYIERFTKVPIYKFTDYSSYLQAGCKRIWATYSACDITASVILDTPFSIQDGAEKVILPRQLKAQAPDLERILRQPNPYDSWEELMYQLVFHLKLLGNGFWIKDQMDLKGRPKCVFSVLPQNMKVIPDLNTRVAGYQYFVNGRTIDFDIDEVIHFRRMHPMDNIMGLGDCEAGQDLLSDFINRNIYNEKFYENGAMPSGVLTKEDQVDDEPAWRKLVDMFREKYQGKKNSGKVMMLNGKWSYQQLGLNAQQMQQIEKDKASAEYIFMLHGVPLSLAGWSNAANYATASLDERNFRRYKIKPLISNIVGKFNSDTGIVKAFNKDWQMGYEIQGLVDLEQVIADYLPLFNNGAMTPNELRMKAGMPRIEGMPSMDQFFVSKSIVPIDMAGQADPGTPDVQSIMKTVLGENTRFMNRKSLPMPKSQSGVTVSEVKALIDEQFAELRRQRR